MIGVLVIAHAPLATALIHCTRHIFGEMPMQLAALDVIPDEDPDGARASARYLIERINDGSGVLVLTDLYGATPARIAARLAEAHRIAVLCGVNLPTLVKALGRRKGADLDALVPLLIGAGRGGLLELGCDPNSAPTAGEGRHAPG